MSYDIILCHIISYRIILYHVISLNYADPIILSILGTFYRATINIMVLNLIIKLSFEFIQLILYSSTNFAVNYAKQDFLILLNVVSLIPINFLSSLKGRKD